MDKAWISKHIHYFLLDVIALTSTAVQLSYHKKDIVVDRIIARQSTRVLTKDRRVTIEQDHSNKMHFNLNINFCEFVVFTYHSWYDWKWPTYNKQSGRSPKVVALLSATNLSGNVI